MNNRVGRAALRLSGAVLAVTAVGEALRATLDESP
jgi:hypothetical protein